MNKLNGFPQKQGLYDPQFEKDSCGVGFIANIKGKKSHVIIQQGLEILNNLTHRGAVGADSNTGDGAGIMIQIPHNFFLKQAKVCNFDLPEEGTYGVGMIFLPQDPHARTLCEGICEKILRDENLKLIGWRNVPIQADACGLTASGTRPVVHQLFIGNENLSQKLFERKLYIVRKQIENAVRNSNRIHTESFYICSLSSKTLIYKGQLLAHQIKEFYIDLCNPAMESAIALVHQRYSTNTFPSWDRAHPFRYVAHNGEINTLRGNVNWMNAREGIMESSYLGKDLKKVFPILEPDGSDSANLDNALELLIASGKSLAHAVCMLIPEAWQEHTMMDEEQKAFYEYHATLMEPWDGPAAIAFSDGVQIGATLDRNGLRPARYYITQDDTIVLASETGVLPEHSDKIIKKDRLQPGKMLLIDTQLGRIISNEEIKSSLANEHPYKHWLKDHKLYVKDLPTPHMVLTLGRERVLQLQKVYGYSEEELKKVIAPMCSTAKEPIVSMGNDTPLALLSDQSELLYNYFKQLFAQVTNPPIDPIREKLVMSLAQFIGDKGNLLDDFSNKRGALLALDQPILDTATFDKIAHINHIDFRSVKIPMVYPVAQGGQGLKEALSHLNQHVEDNIHEGYNIIILSDRNIDKYHAPIPALLAVSSVHHHLIKRKLRLKIDIIVETGEARDIMHMALLLGYGAAAINPYIAFDSIYHLLDSGLYLSDSKLTYEQACKNYIKALSDSLLKTFSKMGIGTLQSYSGAQIFECIGICSDVVSTYFPGTPSRIGGITLDIIAKETGLRHQKAFNTLRNPYISLPDGGSHQWRPNGQRHLFNPETISKLQEACKTNNYERYKEYASLINNQSQKLSTIRGLLKFKTRGAIPLDEVESIEKILPRFATGAMSFGSLSAEAHETLAIAMNTIGGKSNSGEGGESTERLYNAQKRSSIKQVASGRFGVNTEYVVNCDELQIKMAQGAKPGEGGHLPGDKVTKEIAQVRNSTPGIDLISPPPHHDIYSIEDLAQLIYDLKNVNEHARINVKLVSEVGVGTVAAGVAKAHADVVLISGHDGGTGAAPISSIKYTGLPWELGLAETQQTLLLNDLRSRIVVQTDGQLKTGRDVAIAILLGAEEFGFATAALIVSGCIMMRKCQQNTCPVGVATQDPELRKHFRGNPAHIINFFRFIASELREIMAALGFRTVEEMIGRVDMLEPNSDNLGWKSSGIDFDAILYKPELPERIQPRQVKTQNHDIHDILDRLLIKDAMPILKGKKVSKQYSIRNVNRSVGTMLSGALTKELAGKPLEEDILHYKFVGSAGQSFGAFAIKGITLELEGDCNDYMGKALSGGRLILYPSKMSNLKAEENIIVGNTLLYGATSGDVYIRGIAGERFAVRNSGATAVVEGIGDHGCEYMTGGIVLVLGDTGRNFGAGMSGGIAYIYDKQGDFIENKCNHQIVLTESVEDTSDIANIKTMLENHLKYTQSTVAKDILDSFEESLTRFVKVVSPAYKEILKKQQKDSKTLLEV